MKPNRRDFLALGVGALAVATLPRALRGRDHLVRRTVPMMGTVTEIAVRHPSETWAQRGIDAALAELRRVDRTMSHFSAESEVGQLNALAGRQSVAVSDDTAAVLAAALRWAEASGGRFDPCLGKLIELWHVETRSVPPTDAEISAAGRGSHFRSLEVDRTGSVPRAVIASPDAAVDLGGIAVGYGVDLAARALRDQGIFNAIVNVGGDLIAMGVDADDEPWRVGVRSPDHVEQMVATLRVSDRAVTTSGDYFKYFQYGGRRYHHILDPVTGEPRLTTMHSLTIEAASCIDADAGATALYGLDRPTAERILGVRAPGARVAHSV